MTTYTGSVIWRNGLKTTLSCRSRVSRSHPLGSRELTALCLAVGCSIAFGCGPAEVSPPATRLYTDCHYYTSSGHAVGRIKEFEALPSAIQAKVVAHLKERLGDSFYQRIQFSGGQVVDEESEAEQVSDDEVAARRAAKYALHFVLELPDLQKGYCAQLEVDNQGNVIEEIALPSIATNSIKGNLVSPEVALRQAAEAGLGNMVTVELGYDRASDSLVWLVGEQASSSDSGARQQIARIDAHTGKFIMWTERTGRFSKGAEGAQ